jgi:hypothetical protein
VTGTPPDTTLLRATANALWPHLRRNRWKRHRETRDLADHGDRPPYRSIGTATIPNASRADDQHVITDERYIRATVWADEWPGGTNLVIELTLPRHQAALDALDADVITALKTAYQLATCRAPFERATNRHGTPTLRRNSNDPHLTAPAAAAIEHIAHYAEIHVVPQHAVDDALFTDDDISLAGVEAATGVRTSLVLPCTR